MAEVAESAAASRPDGSPIPAAEEPPAEAEQKGAHSAAVIEVEAEHAPAAASRPVESPAAPTAASSISATEASTRDTTGKPRSPSPEYNDTPDSSRLSARPRQNSERSGIALVEEETSNPSLKGTCSYRMILLPGPDNKPDMADFVIDTFPFVIGRKCAKRATKTKLSHALDDKRVSTIHCTLAMNEGTLSVSDHNGTAMNGVKIGKNCVQVINHNETFAIILSESDDKLLQWRLEVADATSPVVQPEVDDIPPSEISTSDGHSAKLGLHVGGAMSWITDLKLSTGEAVSELDTYGGLTLITSHIVHGVAVLGVVSSRPPYVVQAMTFDEFAKGPKDSTPSLPLAELADSLRKHNNGLQACQDRRAVHALAGTHRANSATTAAASKAVVLKKPSRKQAIAASPATGRTTALAATPAAPATSTVTSSRKLGRPRSAVSVPATRTPASGTLQS